MLDIAWPELMVIGIVAVVVIGPKDLPKVMNTMGRWAGKARTMAQDVQRSFEQLQYEADIADKLKQYPKAHMHASATHSDHGFTSTAHAAEMETNNKVKEKNHEHLGST